MFGNANAFISISTASSTPIDTDPITGAPIFGGGSSITVNCTLEEVSSPERRYDLPGQDNIIAYLEGRVIGTPPTTLKTGNYYGITVTLQNEVTEGRFYVVKTPISRMGLESVFGYAIAGYLIS